MPEGVSPALRERVRRIERPAAHGVVPFGIAAVDRILPGGGLTRGAVHEILGAGGDEEDGALAAAFIAGIAGRLTLGSTGGGAVLWCLRRPDLYGPGLAAHGLDPSRLVLVRAARDDDMLWAIEEGLRAAGVAAVAGEVGRLPAVASRRLQLAAERSGITAFLLRRWCRGEEAARERPLPNAAATRWRISAMPSHPPSIPSPASGDGPPPAGGEGSRWGRAVGRRRWRVELLRCRGGGPAAWEMEVANEAGSLSVAEALADRPDLPRRAARSADVPAPYRSTG